MYCKWLAVITALMAVTVASLHNDSFSLLDHSDDPAMLNNMAAANSRLLMPINAYWKYSFSAYIAEKAIADHVANKSVAYLTVIYSDNGDKRSANGCHADVVCADDRNGGAALIKTFAFTRPINSTSDMCWFEPIRCTADFGSYPMPKWTLPRSKKTATTTPVVVCQMAYAPGCYYQETQTDGFADIGVACVDGDTMFAWPNYITFYSDVDFPPSVSVDSKVPNLLGVSTYPIVPCSSYDGKPNTTSRWNNWNTSDCAIRLSCWNASTSAWNTPFDAASQQLTFSDNAAAGETPTTPSVSANKNALSQWLSFNICSEALYMNCVGPHFNTTIGNPTDCGQFFRCIGRTLIPDRCAPGYAYDYIGVRCAPTPLAAGHCQPKCNDTAALSAFYTTLVLNGAAARDQTPGFVQRSFTDSKDGKSLTLFTMAMWPSLDRYNIQLWRATVENILQQLRKANSTNLLDYAEAIGVLTANAMLNQTVRAAPAPVIP